MQQAFIEILRSSIDERRTLFETVAAHLGTQAANVEKDLYVCWVLDFLFNRRNGDPVGLYFKGGIEALESAAVVASERLVQAQDQRDAADSALKQVIAEKAELAKNLANLQAALRNAESDFRAAQRTIDGFERNRREDRDEIRSLQKRIEGLAGENSSLKAKALGGQRKVRARRTKASSSRLR